MTELGLIVGAPLGVGLMALVFWSSRKGFDESAAAPPEPHQDDDRPSGEDPPKS